MALSQPEQKEWQGQTSAKFTTAKRYIEPSKPEQKDHPLFSMGSKRHYSAQRSSEFVYKPCQIFVPQVDRETLKCTGIRKIVRDNVIVKPKVERLQLSHGVTPEDLREFVGAKEFLTKFNGVK